ncbi:hypothetical protein [Algoriphagus hitonicola]|uniref:Uncharacterized protein n=1 Tax=Algoriphagus hitonicola TaxID=435880 RepID=A0A1I2RYL6_9BACT|nr:hypothetical protein [Algoriphagus hitonicola]SFG45143.1 hypothetical protein SAMN04487988_10422 [Algoriphagus hitonicola]
MTVQINSNYLENYSKNFASKVCDRYYAEKQFITGQDIVQLTSAVQVNFFVIKRLFELWQEELEKLKSNPYFDYRDIAVHEALTQFMNVLSRRIKVERSYLEPLVAAAVQNAIQLATDPVGYYQSEIDKAPESKINEYLKENKKYYKWHVTVISFLVDKTGFGHDRSAYKKAIAANYQAVKENLESVNLLLATLGDVQAFDLDAYLVQEEVPSSPVVEKEKKESESDSSFFDQMGEDTSVKPTVEPIRETPPAPIQNSTSNGKKLNSEDLKSRFSIESYRGMKAILGELSESLAINQRFMFTKELFDGNADLLGHALKSIDDCRDFDQAIDLVNQRYVSELDWDVQSEAVHEFTQLIYRKFAD